MMMGTDMCSLLMLSLPWYKRSSRCFPAHQGHPKANVMGVGVCSSRMLSLLLYKSTPRSSKGKLLLYLVIFPVYHDSDGPEEHLWSLPLPLASCCPAVDDQGEYGVQAMVEPCLTSWWLDTTLGRCECGGNSIGEEVLEVSGFVRLGMLFFTAHTGVLGKLRSLCDLGQVPSHGKYLASSCSGSGSAAAVLDVSSRCCPSTLMPAPLATTGP